MKKITQTFGSKAIRIYLKLFIIVLILPTSLHAITWTYYDKSNQVLNNPTDEEIKDLAHMRTSDSNVTQYALRIEHDFSETWATGYFQNIGNPSPDIGLHWVTKNDEVSCEVDGFIPDAYNFNSRYVATGFVGNDSINEGRPIYAIQFDGIDDYIQFDGPGLGQDAYSFVIEFHAKRNRLNAKEIIISQGTSSSGNGLQIGFNSSNYMVFEVSDYTPVVATEKTNDTIFHKWRFEYVEVPSTYHNLTASGFRLKMYCDNQLIANTYIPSNSYEQIEERSSDIYDYACYSITNCEPGANRDSGDGDNLNWYYFYKKGTDFQLCIDHWGNGWHNSWNAYTLPAALCADGGYSNDENKCNDELCYCKGSFIFGKDRCKDVWYDQTDEKRSWDSIWQDIKRWEKSGTTTIEETVYYNYDRKYSGYSDELNIGKGLTGYYFQGQLKEVKIYRNAAMLAYWHLNDGTSDKIKDSRGNHTGRLNNFNVDTAWISEEVKLKYYTFDDIQPRQYIKFKMEYYATIIYNWDRQYAVSINTYPESMKDLPVLEITNGTGTQKHTGSGKWWYHEGTSLKSSSIDGCLQVIGYKNTSSYDPTKIIEKTEVSIKELSEGVSISWQYEAPQYEETVIIGMPVTFKTVPQELFDQIKKDEKPEVKTSDPTLNYYVWSEYDKQLYPLIGDKHFQVEWKMKESTECEKPVIISITTKWPDNAHYIHTANTPPVPLDPSKDDDISFKELKYSEGDGFINSNKEFLATQKGKSTLLFTRSYIDHPLPSETSLYFDGTDDYVDLGQDIALNKNHFTIEFMARRASTGNNHFALGNGQRVEKSGLYMGFNEDDAFVFGIDQDELVT